MTRVLALLTVIAALTAPAASAKGITALRLCGTDGCKMVAIPNDSHEFPGLGGDPSYPPAAGPFLDVELILDGSRAERLWYVPGARAFARRDENGSIRWTRNSAQRIDALIAAAARGVTPYTPRAVAAFVGDRRILGDVSGYLDLFGVESAGFALTGSGRYVAVSIKTQPTSPWALTGLWFYPEEGLLQRGADLLRLPQGVADDLRAARPIGSAPRAPFDWPLVVGSLSAAALLALAAVVASRRARSPHPGTA